MNTKHRVGERVKIRKDLDVINEYGGIGVETEMFQYRNKIATITEIEERNFSSTGYVYFLDIDNEDFYWSDDMFEDSYKTRGFEFISQEQGLKDCIVDGLFKTKLPKRSTTKSAGYDVFAPFDIILEPNEEVKVPTGIKSYMQDGEVLLAFPRSGLGFKYYCRLANSIGVIDGDYYNNPNNEGHIFVKLRNEGNKTMIIKQGEGMCQFIFMPFLLADGDDFENGNVREGGFGHTTK